MTSTTRTPIVVTTVAAKAAYGVNPHPGVNPNLDRGWGGHQWPAGVPGNLLAVVTVPGPVRIVIRKELAELVGLMYQIALVKYGRNFATGWTGGYENRAIAGTNSPSNHSRGKAIDNDARNNPMSYTFICDIPPGLISDWESLGWYWGGRYSGKTDTMHLEFIDTPASVPLYVDRARKILGAAAPATPTAPATTPAAPTTPTTTYEAYAAAAAGSRTVRLYSAGDDVKVLQARLGLPADGKYGPDTQAAVTAFQQQHNLSADGVAGPNTWAALLGQLGPAPTTPPAYPGLLTRGMYNNSAVLTMQRRLNLHRVGSGAPPVSEDADFGDGTQAAVVWFQVARKLTADGKVGPATWKSLWS